MDMVLVHLNVIFMKFMDFLKTMLMPEGA